ncbi:hypothetical protein RIF29_33939 [Crotalaria pallida]|uniref:Secreted protein n=1 Tax=Crotalaria pallida TaxID=3830 RepID=A0AAN9HX42_CROPI
MISLSSSWVVCGLFSLAVPLSIPPPMVSSLIPPLSILLVPLSHDSSYLCVCGSSVIHALSFSLGPWFGSRWFLSLRGSLVYLSLDGSWFVYLNVSVSRSAFGEISSFALMN